MHSSGEADTLIIDLQQDRIEAFDALYAAWHQPVYRNICKLIHRHEIAEDLLQDVFLTLWQKRHSLDPYKPVASWLFVVSYNKAVDWLKNDLRESKLLSLLKDPASHMESDPGALPGSQPDAHIEWQLAAIHKAAGQLPLRKRQAFQLCRVEGRSYEEAGAILGISSDTVKEYVKTSSSFIRRTIVAQSTHLPGIAALAIFIGQHKI
jgi:RNA polymerase sigma-70 factor (ECF subfamily)